MRDVTPMSRRSVLLVGLFAIVLVLGAGVWVAKQQEVVPEEVRHPIAADDAVTLAEQFVRENGYTDAPDNDIKARLDPEGLEWTSDRSEQLKVRRNTLFAKAVGIRATAEGWGVAFEYVSDRANCRILTMAVDGSRLRMQHQDGIREYWVGFGAR